MQQILWLPYGEYLLRMEAYQLKQIERQDDIALQAWLNREVKATTGKGKSERYKYTKLTQLYDRQEAISRIRSQWEPNYAPPADVKAKQDRLDNARHFDERMTEFRRLKEEGKIIPWRQRQHRKEVN
jgi:hypothetical protein